MLINMFLLACEVFTEFYTDSAHVASARYLYFGLHGRHALVPWIWTAIGMNLLATVLLVLPASRGLKSLNVACVLSIVGIWIEKGMGLIVPAFVPTPLGEIVEYAPTPHEIVICLGIWAFGPAALHHLRPRLRAGAGGRSDVTSDVIGRTACETTTTSGTT